MNTSAHSKQDSHSIPIENSQQLADYLAAGCKPKSAWRLGTEHEKFGFTREDLRPLQHPGERGIENILKGLTQFDWQPVTEGSKLIALKSADGCSITLEPGGQLELSGTLLENIHQTCSEVNTHLDQVKTVCEPMNIAFLGMGFQPKWDLADISWMPKGRYKIMRDYMPKVGSMGHDMMKRTCTVQVNLDFSSEADMLQKFRVSLALQPLATALFANSPFKNGRPTNYLSLRSQVWLDTDPNRTGMLPFVFDAGMGFERYVEYMLDVPMYFIYRNGQYIDASGQSFREFMRGRLPALPNEKPTLKDWEDHLTTAFPEVRLKRFLEMRGADGGEWRSLCALPALWVGLLYDQSALDAAWDLVKNWPVETLLEMREAVPAQGLKTQVGGVTLLEVAQQVLEIAHAGLTARDRKNSMGDNETGFLQPLQYTLDSGKTPAERKLDKYYQQWQKSVDPLFTEHAY